MKKLLKILGIAAIIGFVAAKLKGGSCSSCGESACESGETKSEEA